MAAFHAPGDRAVPPGNASGTSNLRPVAIANWLLAVAVLVVIMVVIGGITRLTESGLSITEWKPVTGTLPPLSEAAWRAEFAAYREIGEYQQVTGPAGMTLANYKFIYFWEWAHRFMGRLIGLAFALPLAWFWLRGAIPAGYRSRLVALLALGGLQGVFGWFMVRSGLSTQVTDVSHFWLSIHLLTALFTLAGLTWTALDLRLLARGRPRAGLAGFSIVVAAIFFVQLLLGAWVAGLNAGLASDSWPLMQGGFLPEYDGRQGFFHALTHDPFLLHFAHRWWAFVAAIALFMLARRAKTGGEGGARAASIAVNVLLGVQILLGIATVMSGVALWLAVAHQMVGALLVAATAWAAHLVGRRGDQTSGIGAAEPVPAT